MTTCCRTCGKPYIQVDVDHAWPDCDCHIDPTCRHCEGTGMEWMIEPHPETGEWHRVRRRCRCQTPLSTLWAVVGIAAVLLPLLAVLWEALK